MRPDPGLQNEAGSGFKNGAASPTEYQLRPLHLGPAAPCLTLPKAACFLYFLFLPYRAHRRSRHLRAQALAEPSALVPRSAGWKISGVCKRASTASPVEATFLFFEPLDP